MLNFFGVQNPRCFTFYSGYCKLYDPYFAPFINPVEHQAGIVVSDGFSSEGSFLFLFHLTTDAESAPEM